MAFPTTGLVSYWKLDEASGTRVDSHGTNHLTPTNAPVGAAGKIGNGCDFESSSSQYLSHPDPDPLGDESFTYTVWFKRETIGLQTILLSKDSSSGGGRSYFLAAEPGIHWAWSGGLTVSLISPINANDTNWHFIVAGYDAVANVMFLQVDANAMEYAAAASGPAAAGVPFHIGSRPFGGFEWYFDGLIDEVGLWRRVLTAQERTDLYNGGAGLAYSTSGSMESPITISKVGYSVPIGVPTVVNAGIVAATPAALSTLTSPGALEKSTLIGGPFTAYTQNSQIKLGFIRPLGTTTVTAKKVNTLKK